MDIAKNLKKLWNPDKLNMWEIFDVDEIEKSPINNITKEFLKIGFPREAAPFLDFGWKSYGGKFLNISEYYSTLNLDEKTKNYWIFGSDNSGNPICFDISHDDNIVLLDHEQRFEIIDAINKNIVELAECLLLYKNFITRIRNENGDDAYINSNISKLQVEDLKDEFKQLNINIFKESGFWRSEINALGR